MTLGGLTWDKTGEHYYYTGIDGVALYVWDENKYPENENESNEKWYGAPVAWNGVTAVNESPSGAESNKFYADNIEYLNLLSKEEFGCTLECYQVPEEFDACDGIMTVGNTGMKFHGKSRKPFGLVYRVQKGSDTKAAGEEGYVYHIIYGCKASPSSRDFATVNDSPEAQTFSYEISTTPLTNNSIFNHYHYPESIKEVVHLEFDSSNVSNLNRIEKVLYGGVFNLSEFSNTQVSGTNKAIYQNVAITDGGDPVSNVLTHIGPDGNTFMRLYKSTSVATNIIVKADRYSVDFSTGALEKINGSDPEYYTLNTGNSIATPLVTPATALASSQVLDIDGVKYIMKVDQSGSQAQLQFYEIGLDNVDSKIYDYNSSTGEQTGKYIVVSHRFKEFYNHSGCGEAFITTKQGYVGSTEVMYYAYNDMPITIDNVSDVNYQIDKMPSPDFIASMVG